jgi:hypothetical protein
MTLGKSIPKPFPIYFLATPFEGSSLFTFDELHTSLFGDSIEENTLSFFDEP